MLPCFVRHTHSRSLIATLYLGIGDNFNSNNIINMAAVLFMWIVMPVSVGLSTCGVHPARGVCVVRSMRQGV